MEIHRDSGGIADEDIEAIDEEHLESIHPATSHGLLLLSELPDDYQPLNGENHTRRWQLPTNFGTDPQVDPPQQCIDCCNHAGQEIECVDGGVDPGFFLQDRWDLSFLLFQ